MSNKEKENGTKKGWVYLINHWNLIWSTITLLLFLFFGLFLGKKPGVFFLIKFVYIQELYIHRSAPLIYPLPMPISPSMIYPYRCRSDLASLIFPPGRGYQPLWYAPIHFVNLRWTSKHTQFNPPIFINKSLEKYKHTGPGCSKVG